MQSKIMALLLALQISCSNELQITTVGRGPETFQLAEPTANAIAGRNFTIQGRSFDASVFLVLAEEIHNPVRFTSSSGTFNLPETMASGEYEAKIYAKNVSRLDESAERDQRGLYKRLKITVQADRVGGSESFPVCSSSGQQNCVVTGTWYAGPSCEKNGSTACFATGNYVAALKCEANGSDCYLPQYTAGIQPLKAINRDMIEEGKASIKNTLTVGDVNGTLADCTADGAINCVSNNLYTAAMTSGLAAKVASGLTVAGVLGTAAAESHSDCAADGAISCVATTTYTAAYTTGLAAKIISGQTVAGVAGTAIEESHSNCSTNGGQGCVAAGAYYAATTCAANASNCYIPNYVSTTQPLRAISYDSIDAGKSAIRNSLTIAGVTGTLTDCSGNGSVGCVTSASFQSADLTNLAAGNIKRGISLAGTTGTFPSSSTPLPRYTDSGATTNTGGSDITDLTTFITQLTTDGSFEYWDSSGIRRTGSGDSDITAANVKSAMQFENFSITGSFSPNCTSDNQTNCTTTATYKSVDTSALTTWDIRRGKTAGGIIGALTLYTNMANTTVFDRTSGTGAVTGLDIYDTIDDFSNNGTFPTQNPGSWAQATGANWTSVVANTVYRDEITGLVWLRDGGSTYTWEQAITYCENSTSGSRSDWRLPTQKELQQSYVDGVWSIKTSLSLSADDYWSSTTDSAATTRAFILDPYDGAGGTFLKTGSYKVLCVAP